MFDKGSPDYSVYRNVAEDAAEKFLYKALAKGKFPDYYCGGQECIIARRQIIEAALNPDISVILLIKECGQCYTIYDCQSQADFDELLNQEIK